MLPSDDAFRLAPATVRAAMEADVARGLTPFPVAALAARRTPAPSTRSRSSRALCREHGAWLHVDAAYGGFAALADRGRCLPGLEQPTRSRSTRTSGSTSRSSAAACSSATAARCARAFEILPDYLHDARADEGEVNFSDLGLQLTRSARALKLWVSLRFFGVDAFRAAIRRSLELAALAASRVEESEPLELMAPPSLGVVCFRRRDLDEDGNAGVAAALERSGAGLVSSTRLHGRFALRLCVLNHQSSAEDVERVLDVPRDRRARAGAPEHERHPAIVSSWPGLPAADLPSLRALPLFAGLEPDQAAQVAAHASLREAAAASR